MIRWGMTIDLKRCIGCQSCSMACKMKNGTPPGIFYRKVMEKVTGKYPTVRRSYIPISCMHCSDPPCARNCPTGVFYKREDGIVMYDSSKCYGAKVCRMACPYDAISFIDKVESYYPGGFTPIEKIWDNQSREGTAGKCDFCADRIAEGLKPSCVKTCPTDALKFGDLNDVNSEVSRLILTRDGYQLHADLGTNPSVYYLP
ncbi:MAG: 4Fe-4S dicluster domain-containing protein [Syntrophobacterales bacterium]|nr:4Fe-4S dicluster domain-containing protein [Syntrophobacterales bacterium]